MTLRLSDDQLARLRLECLNRAAKWADGQQHTPAWIKEAADELVAWCLRDRPVEPEET